MSKKTLKLITESSTENRFEIDDRDPGKPKTIKMQGVYIQADVRNGNNRIYDYELLKPEVDKFIKEKIDTNTALEELEHGDSPAINPTNVCSRTISLKEDNKSWIGTSVVLASDPKFGIIGTPKGDILASLLTFDCNLGHSTRSLGNVNESTGKVEDLQLLFIDTVCCPSIGVFNDSNANRLVNGILESRRVSGFVNGILESKQFVVDVHGRIMESKFEAFEKSISKMPNTNISLQKAQFLGQKVTEFLNSLTI